MGSKVNIILFLVLSSSMYVLSAQDIPLLIGDRTELELDFDYEGGLIIVDARLNDELPLRLILDTGAENLILLDKSIINDIGFQLGKKIEMRGADLDTTVHAFICRKIPFSLGNCKSIERDFIVLEDDLINVEQMIGTQVDGILGGRAFWGLTLEIDYEKQKVRLHKAYKNHRRQIKDHHQIDISIESHKPYMTTKLEFNVGNQLETKLLMDTGSSLGFLLLLESHESLKLTENYVKGPLGKGFGGDILGYITRLKCLRLNRALYFPRPITHLQYYDTLELTKETLNDRDGIIGNPILSRFNIIIDYLNERAYLKPIANYNRVSNYDKSGLIINAVGEKLNEFIIRYVIAGSPADLAGIQKGDKLKKLGLLPLKWKNLSRIMEILSKKEGKNIKLKIIRDGIELKKQFILKDYLNLRSQFE